MKLLFVCDMNVARSQMAEALTKKFSGRYEVRSAGLRPGEWEGEKIALTKCVWRCLEEVGCEAQGAVVDKLAEAWVTWADVVVVFGEGDGWPPYLERSSKVRVWDIPGPDGDEMDGYRKMRDAIAVNVRALLREQEERLGYG